MFTNLCWYRTKIQTTKKRQEKSSRRLARPTPCSLTLRRNRYTTPMARKALKVAQEAEEVALAASRPSSRASVGEAALEAASPSPKLTTSSDSSSEGGTHSRTSSMTTLEVLAALEDARKRATMRVAGDRIHLAWAACSMTMTSLAVALEASAASQCSHRCALWAEAEEEASHRCRPSRVARVACLAQVPCQRRLTSRMARE